MKPQELRNMTVDELTAKESDIRKEYFNLRMQVATGQSENPMTLRAKRRDIARVKTIIAEKEKNENE